MGLFAKLIYKTPLGKYYRHYNRKKWESENAREEQQLLPARVKFYKQFLKPTDLVFDVGANIGNRVEAFLKCEAKVIAIEPQPACIKTLKEKFRNSIIIEEIGLGEKEDVLEMHIGTDSTVSTFDSKYIEETKNKFKYTDWEGTIKVPVSTLDHLVMKYGIPQFCKIDVEGFELQVLKGLHCTIPYISFEYIVPERTEAAFSCVQHLHGLNPSGLFNYSIGESMNWAFDHWKSFHEFAEHMNTKEFNDTSFGDIYFKS